MPQPCATNRARGERVRNAALTLIDLRGPQTPAQLAAQIGIKPIVMCRHLRRMEAEGVVVLDGKDKHSTRWRRPSPDDNQEQ